MNNENRKVILGSRITQRRKQLNIKQSELAEQMGLSDNQISNIENGKSFPKLSNFMLLCDILNCNADYFFSGILRNSIDDNISDMIASLSIEEQNALWELLNCYIHRDKNNRK